MRKNPIFSAYQASPQVAVAQSRAKKRKGRTTISQRPMPGLSARRVKMAGEVAQLRAIMTTERAHPGLKMLKPLSVKRVM
jgi:hypothetical protein